MTRDATDASSATDAKRGSVRWLAALNFVIADVQNGMGPYVALFLESSAQWNPAQIGTALAFGNIAQVLSQTPIGALIDQLHRKRTLVAVGIAMIAIACIATPLVTTLPVVSGAQVLIGIAGSIFPPTLAAMALGLVGRERMDRQLGTNQSFNAAGNLFAAVLLGAAGYFIGLGAMFAVVVALSVAALFCLRRIRPDDIDYALSRGADDEAPQRRSKQQDVGAWAATRDVLATFVELGRQRSVVVFLACAVLFHFSNAAMVPLVTEMLAKDQGAKKAVLFTSGYMVASQLVFVVVAAWSGRLAATIGRKPLFLFAFAALATRGVLYTLSSAPSALIAVQCMDGLGAGVFGVVSVLIVADLTKGTGRFNAAQGAVAAAVGIGAFLSNIVAGFVARAVGTTPAFLALAALAATGFLLFAFLMPETKAAAGERRRAPAIEPGRTLST